MPNQANQNKQQTTNNSVQQDTAADLQNQAQVDDLKYESMHDKELSQKKEVASTQLLLDVESIKDGVVVLKNKGLRAVVMCSSINYALMSEDEQKAKLFAYQDFLNSLKFPIQIVVQSKKLNIKRYLEKIKQAERVQQNDSLRLQTAKYAEFIASLVDLAHITTNHFYVVVPYITPLRATGNTNILDTVKNFFSPTKEIQSKMAGFEIDKRELILRVQTVVSGLQGIGVKAAVLDTSEVIELLYSFYNPAVAQNQVLGEIEKIRLQNF